MSDFPGTPRIPDEPADDRDGWMGLGTALSDHDIDELIAGRSPAGLHDLRPLAEVTLALRVRAATEVAPPMGHTLRMALADAPAMTARNQRSRIRRRFSGLAAVVVGIVGFATTTAANALPAPLQHVVADAGALVGVDVPTPEERSDNPPGSSDARQDEDGAERGGGKGRAEGEPATDEASDPTKVRPEPKGSGPPEGTPGGAVPADPAEPGTPGDHTPATPATPATPPEDSEGGERPTAGDGGTPTLPKAPKPPKAPTRPKAPTKAPTEEDTTEIEPRD